MSERIYIALYDDDLYPLHKIPVKNAMLTPAEAVERMAKAMIAKNNATPMYIYRELATAALDALIGANNGK